MQRGVDTGRGETRDRSLEWLCPQLLKPMQLMCMQTFPSQSTAEHQRIRGKWAEVDLVSATAGDICSHCIIRGSSWSPGAVFAITFAVTVALVLALGVASHESQYAVQHHVADIAATSSTPYGYALLTVVVRL